MLVEVDLDNKEGLIVPGSFVQVTLKIPVPSLVQVPVAALVMRGTAPSSRSSATTTASPSRR